MKKKTLFNVFLCCSLLGGVGITTSSLFSQPSQAMRAEAEENEGKDYIFGGSGVKLSTATGDFPSLPRFLNAPNVGFAIEFKIKDDSAKSIVFKLFSGSTAVTSNIYMYRAGATPTRNVSYYRTVYSNGTYEATHDVGRMIDMGSGWYRYELLGYEVNLDATIGPVAAQGDATVDNLQFQAWGADYKNNVTVRKIEKIGHYTGVIGSDNKTVSATEAVAAKGYVKQFLPVKNWRTSGYGMFFEYTKSTGNLHGYLVDDWLTGDKNTAKATVNGEWTYKTTGSVTSANHFNNNGVMSFGGKVIDLGDMYRVELMFADAAGATSGNEGFEFNSVFLDLYGTTVGDRGIIDSYSYYLTTNVGGVETKTLMEQGEVVVPADPSAPSGKHFAGWYEDSTFTTPFTATKLTADKTIYAKFDDHSYSTNYEWAQDFSTCKGTATCACGDKVEETVNGVYAKDQDATCLGNELGHYTADFTKAQFEDQATAAKSFEKTGTKHVDTLTKVDGKAATCLEDGWKDYYKCGECGKLFETTDESKPIADLEAWKAGDGKVAKHVESLTKVDGQAATCLADGWKDYYKCNECGKFYETDDVSKPIADLAAWKAGDGKLAKHVDTLTKRDGKPATCKEDGWKDYYVCGKCNKFYADAEGQNPIADIEAWKLGDGKLTKVSHTLVEQEGKAATCTEDGWNKYYKCSGCGDLFSDAQGANKIEDLAAWKLGDGKLAKHDHVAEKVDGQAATCEEPGWKDYYQCEECEAIFWEDANKETLIGDTGDLLVWKNTQGKLPTVAHDMEKQNGQAATCTVDGWKDYYKCKDCEELFADAAGTQKIADLAAWKAGDGKILARHTYKYVAEVAATAEKDGMKAHYVCEKCGELFVTDASGNYVKTTAAELAIKYTKTSGCGGSIVATSALLSALAFAGAALLIAKRKKED